MDIMSDQFIVKDFHHTVDRTCQKAVISALKRQYHLHLEQPYALIAAPPLMVLPKLLVVIKIPDLRLILFHNYEVLRNEKVIEAHMLGITSLKSISGALTPSS